LAADGQAAGADGGDAVRQGQPRSSKKKLTKRQQRRKKGRRR
jgi:hypothetical protein